MFNHLAHSDRQQFAETGFPGVTVSTIWDDEGTGAGYISLSKGSIFPAHDHEGREQLYIISGKIRFGEIVVSAGDFLSADPGDGHDAEAFEDSVFFIVHTGGPIIVD
jgi:quercetin dioxygenase-like cupin family protein